MFSVMILEDDTRQQTAIQALLHKTYSSWNLITATTFQEAKKALSSHTFQLFLLDICLTPHSNDTGGLEFGRYLRTLATYRYVPIILLTGLSDKVLPAISDIHCSSYLVKPYKNAELIDAVTYAFQTPGINPPAFMIRDSNGVFQHISPASILYVESDRKNLILHQENSYITIANYTFSKILELLPDNFIQCHRKYVINCDEYTSYDRTMHFIRIKDILLPVGRKYKQELERKINL